jgi:Flp pilus assembly protein TadG
MTGMLARLRCDTRGTMAVETAIVLSVLLFLGLGATQASEVVTKQSQMQAAASQAEQIIAAKSLTSATQLDTIRDILKTSAGLSTDPTVEFQYSCATSTTKTTTDGTCGSNVQWTYVHMRLTYTYTPTWTSFGFGNPITLVVDRTAQVS